MRKVQLFESFFLVPFFQSIFTKKFNSWSQVQKKKVQVFEPFFLEGSILRVILNNGFNSLRHIQRKRIQFFASYSKKKDSILCVVFKEQGFHSLRQIQNKGSILCVILEKQGHFFESWKKVGSTL